MGASVFLGHDAGLRGVGVSAKKVLRIHNARLPILHDRHGTDQGYAGSHSLQKLVVIPYSGLIP